MNKITLIIPAKKEPNALPLVLNEIRQNKLNFEIIIILDKNDTETFEAVKNLNCKIIWQSKRLWECYN